jgi:hypothetical protein
MVLTPDDLVKGAYYHTASAFFRNVTRAPAFYSERIPYGDVFLRARLASHGGGIRAEGLLPGVYRLHDGGIWSGVNRQQSSLNSAVSYYWVAVYEREQGNVEWAEKCLSLSAEYIVESLLDSGVDPRNAVAWRNSRSRRLVRSVRNRVGRVRWMRAWYGKARNWSRGRSLRLTGQE